MFMKIYLQKLKTRHCTLCFLKYFSFTSFMLRVTTTAKTYPIPIPALPSTFGSAGCPEGLGWSWGCASETWAERGCRPGRASCGAWQPRLGSGAADRA